MYAHPKESKARKILLYSLLRSLTVAAKDLFIVGNVSKDGKYLRNMSIF